MEAIGKAMARFQHTKLQVPRIWLMSDERLGDNFLKAVKRLPRGSGVIFRHYSLENSCRRDLFRQVRHIARQRGFVLLLSDDESQAIAWCADGWHNRSGKKGQAQKFLQSVPVHGPSEIVRANRCGADLVFLSPLFRTQSHPEAKGLGPLHFQCLASLAFAPVIALGGMNRARAEMLGKKRIYGWAAISAFR
jgi:thiamine-phosphate pyrophosphorylase